jgi:hypothetical protein
MKKDLLILCTVILIFLGGSTTKAQDDCCGLGSIFSSVLQSGIFGGYGFQQYSAEGWNDYVSTYLESQNVSYNDFSFAHGWLVGANLIQLREDDFLIGLKFYYQSVTENQGATGTYLGEDATQELDLKINTWGFGMSFSYIVSKNFDIRIADLYLTFPSVDLKNEIRTVSTRITDEYESAESNIGFSFDTGLVFYPAPPYISIELIGGYAFFSAESMQTADFDELITTSDFIDSGGFFASAVLTVGIPFE